MRERVRESERKIEKVKELILWAASERWRVRVREKERHIH